MLKFSIVLDSFSERRELISSLSKLLSSSIPEYLSLATRDSILSMIFIVVSTPMMFNMNEFSLN